ncbi:YaiI/YqxD family protein [Clostridium cellulovorans]|uniref:UPF0178 protein Clocel_1366 n=1 Tax=Clostridium cellulovorans (strain ATCC 35296 / DSM 3052 / OCM 3 / 743B) TaxID=573061 RepID=D9SVJ5_CLOC7|nr:YaiI/YqxD family protein [Clostridium cellulovorans]ADL51119.1 protein of unknown function DUF188 [Clostridium cellulovorans 743B]
MRILVDGDACPGKSFIEKAAKEYNIEVIIFCNISHRIESDYSTVIYVDNISQGVDIKIANEVKVGDIVVSQDYGVATIALGRKAYAINPRGYIFTNENIDRLLLERHINKKIRDSGGRTQNPKKRNQEDDKRLYDNLVKLINAENP